MKSPARLALALSAAAALLYSAPAAAGDKESFIAADKGATLLCRDCDGHEVELKKNPKRVVICYTSFIELWYLAGGEAVAMVDTANRELLPEKAKALPSIGNFVNPNMEKLLSCEPDLVLLCGKIEKHRAVRGLLNEQGVNNVLFDYENYGDFLRLLEVFAALNGKTVATIPDAKRTVDEVDSIVAKAKAQGKSPRFISLFASAKNLSAETEKSSAAFMIEMLGGENAIDAKGLKIKKSVGSVRFSMERMIMENPEIIFVTTMGDSKRIGDRMKKEMLADPAWRGVKAVKDGKVFFLPNELFLYKPNARYPEAFAHLAKLMYPETKW
jgi:iron complex transport system substrate-binding protein